MSEMVMGTGLFVFLVVALSLAVLAARAALVPQGAAIITLNGRKQIRAKLGQRLLAILKDANINLPSACGGAGTCGQCRLKIAGGWKEVLPNERALLTRVEIEEGTRLACQVTVLHDMEAVVPVSALEARRTTCTVVSAAFLTPFIRELVLALPDDVQLDFTAGAFVQITAPPYRLSFAEYEVPQKFQAIWQEQQLERISSDSPKETSRAYSIANTPEHGVRQVVLLVRLALPPPVAPDCPPGAVSSWLFGLKLGQQVEMSGPFGEFRASDSAREMVLIGGGVGMAPLRAIINDQLRRKRTNRKISFWYGARSSVELIYRREFDELAESFVNFSWTPSLSDPASGEFWEGETGLIHDVVRRQFLDDHPAPEDCEYYLCGPPLMINAVLAALDDAGVDPDSIFNDDFGS